MGMQATWVLTRDGPQWKLRLAGDWISRTTGVRSAAEIRQLLDQAAGATVSVDCRELGRWDSALTAFLRALRDGGAAAKGVRLEDASLPEAVKRLLALAPARHAAEEEGQARPSLAFRLGEHVLRTASAVGALSRLLGETVLRAMTVGWRGARIRPRTVDVLQLLRQGGPNALAIVATVNLLVGAILAFVGAVQFRRFGAGIYVADLVGVAVVREMAAVMTAIVMAGRTGGAYAAEIAAMQGSEEIDALKSFGIPVFDFLVLPRIGALVAMLPLLYVYGCAMGLLGGALVGIATLDLTPSAFLFELQQAVAPREFAIGVVKSISFGALVALTACNIGLRADRSASDVGRAATTAVVAGIVGIIALDAVFAACTNALGL
jgi:phospholipid/cholesterol/gamma-HCH transport system permease protein